MTPDPWCPSTTRHGTVQAYNTDRCRCTAARSDAARYGREWYHRNRVQPLKVSSLGTRRRLEALGAAGWPAEHLAELFGVGTAEALRSLRVRDSILRSSAEKVAAIYADLAPLPGPSSRTRKRSLLRGWLPPSWWAGQDIDDPAAEPRSPWATYLETRSPVLGTWWERDSLDDATDRALDEALDAIDAADEAWLLARRGQDVAA